MIECSKQDCRSLEDTEEKCNEKVWFGVFYVCYFHSDLMKLQEDIPSISQDTKLPVVVVQRNK